MISVFIFTNFIFCIFGCEVVYMYIRINKYIIKKLMKSIIFFSRSYMKFKKISLFQFL